MTLRNMRLKMIQKYEKLFDDEIKQFILISESFSQETVGDSVEEMRQSYNEMVKHFRQARPPSVKVENKKVAFKERSLIYRQYSKGTDSKSDLIYFMEEGLLSGDLKVMTIYVLKFVKAQGVTFSH